MKNSSLFLFYISLLFLPIPFFAQNTVFHSPNIKHTVYSDVTPPLRNMTIITPARGKSEKEIYNETDLRKIRHNQPPPFIPVEDPAWQKDNVSFAPFPSPPVRNFEGIGNISGVYPPDTQGDVSINYYLQVVNMNFEIWDKSGTILFGPVPLGTIWQGIPAPWNTTNNGDPVVLYDQAADRWIISQFSLPNGSQFAELIAVSQTADPTGSWYRYIFHFGTKMPDYPKLGVWPDAYYLSFNQFVGGSGWGGVGACALERSKMLTGDTTARIVYFDLGSSSDPGSMLPSDWDGTITPIANEPDYFAYFNDWSSLTDQYINIWAFHVDWTNITNSTFSEVYSLVTAPFNSVFCNADLGACIPQPGTSVKLESLSDRLMYRLQYRNFETYQSMVTNHTVNVNGSGQAGIRWYELRNSGSGWTIYQQGTFAPDSINRWMGSIAQNSHGDMALGYTVSDSTAIYPTIRYTGRLAGDPLGEMTAGEGTIINGSGYQSGPIGRWGDYSMMSVDPADDSTFWYTQEYIQTTGYAPWQTRVASFNILPSTLTANFSANNLTPLVSSTVVFNDLSSDVPLTWHWSFSPSSISFVNGTNASMPNPQIQFTTNGPYTVTLVVTNASGSSTKVRTNYIHVGTQGLWTGITSTNWNTGSNWNNGLVPGINTTVTIPGSPPNLPVFSGSLTVGAQCQNLILSGAAVMTINGALTINPGCSVTFTGPGGLKLTGDWTDYGFFNSGSGSVEFTSSNPSQITGGIIKSNYLANYSRTTFPVGMTNISGGTPGPTGDDNHMDVNIGFNFNYLGVNYTHIRITCNGWTSLNLTGDDIYSYNNLDLFGGIFPNTTLAPWWDDMFADNTSLISFITTGIAPNRVFTTEWKHLLSFYTGATARLNFQLKLYETTNVIEFCYGNVESGVHYGDESASIGVEDATGGPGHFIEATTGSTTTGITTLVSSVNWPAVNYRFTPPSSTEAFFNVKESKVNATLTIQPGIIVNGNLILNQ